MLLELHVKNLALIEKADVEFGEGLNILTGETGAGKSDRKSTRLNSSHSGESRMPSSA